VSARRLLPLLCLTLALGAVSAASATPPGPNGRIAFSLDAGSGNTELYSVNADGSALRRLTWSPQVEQVPSWSPDGTRIAYESSLGGKFHVWVMNADGSGQTELTSGTQDLDPAWSPDGTQIAYARPSSNGWNLFVMNADGSGLRRVSDVFGNDPAWSPDGRRLAYVGPDGIGVVGLDGSDPHRITAVGAFAAGPSWSPDGTRIVFSRNNAAGYPGELFVVNADGSGEHQLTTDGYANARPSWSPDGTEIVFQRTATPPFGSTLWAIGADGNGLRQVASSAGAIGPDWGSSQVVPEPSPPQAPTIQIYSPEDGALYLPGMQVPAVYLCSSYASVIVSCQGDLPFGALVDLSLSGTRSFTVRAVDAAGRTATVSVTYQVPDLVAPQVDLRTPKDGATYDLGAAVTVDYSCSDPNGSGVAVCSGERPSGYPLDTSQAGTHTFTVLALDKAGNFASATATYTVVAPPQIQISSPANGAIYTLGATALAAYSCASAAGAHVVTCAGPAANGGPLDTGSAGTKTFTVTSSDDGGRNATLTHTYIVAGPPQIQISSPADGATYRLGSTALAAYSCSSAWAVHIVTCDGTAANGNALDTGSVGTKQFAVRATDGLGATATVIHNYNVVYSFSGFDAPVTTTGSLDAAKAGDALPLKFSLHGDNGLSIVTQTTWQPASCSDWSNTAAAATGQGKLTYNALTDRYTDLVATDPKWKGSCRIVDLQLADGTHHTVHVRFTH
jgi:Tol biopolymer transport system component